MQGNGADIQRTGSELLPVRAIFVAPMFHILLARSNQLTAALTCYNRAVELCPHVRLFLVGRGDCYRTMRVLETALADYQQVRVALATALHRQGNAASRRRS